MTTTQTAHAPGTWTVQREELEYSPEGMYLKGLVIATEDAAIAHLIEWQAPLEAEANARLIASAPALLAALKECITEEGAYCLNHDSKALLRGRLASITLLAKQAIALAEGSTL